MYLQLLKTYIFHQNSSHLLSDTMTKKGNGGLEVVLPWVLIMFLPDNWGPGMMMASYQPPPPTLLITKMNTPLHVNKSQRLQRHWSLNSKTHINLALHPLCYLCAVLVARRRRRKNKK
jgi:hypothetical protein